MTDPRIEFVRLTEGGPIAGESAGWCGFQTEPAGSATTAKSATAVPGSGSIG